MKNNQLVDKIEHYGEFKTKRIKSANHDAGAVDLHQVTDCVTDAVRTR